jgi:hypothetical protein
MQKLVSICTYFHRYITSLPVQKKIYVLELKYFFSSF